MAGNDECYRVGRTLGCTIWFQHISHWTDISLSVNWKYLVVSMPPRDIGEHCVHTSEADSINARALYTGSFGDWVALRLARRNKGVLEAEHRLWLYSAALLGLPLGYLLWGIGASHNMHWFGLLFAMAIISFITTCGSQIFVTYLIDSYRALGGEALVTVILVRNMMGPAFDYEYLIKYLVEFCSHLFDIYANWCVALLLGLRTGTTKCIYHCSWPYNRPYSQWWISHKCGKSLRKRSRVKYAKYLQHKNIEDSSY